MGEQDTIIRVFGLKNGGTLEDEEDSISDLKAYVQNVEEDELQTELPRKIFNASRIVAQRISELEKDEYGDYVYREKDVDDLASQNLKQASEVLKFWLNLLKSTNRFMNTTEEINQQVSHPETDDKEIQVELETKLTLSKNVVQVRKSFKRKHSIKSSEMFFKRRDSLKAKNKTSSKKLKDLHQRGSFIVKKEMEPTITTARPFNFVSTVKDKNEISKTTMTVYKLIRAVRDTAIEGEIRVVSVKNVLKILYNIYYDKAANIKDSKVIENQTLAEFLYESFVHKYGIGALSEK